MCRHNSRQQTVCVLFCSHFKWCLCLLILFLLDGKEPLHVACVHLCLLLLTGALRDINRRTKLLDQREKLTLSEF